MESRTFQRSGRKVISDKTHKIKSICLPGSFCCLLVAESLYDDQIPFGAALRQHSEGGSSCTLHGSAMLPAIPTIFTVLLSLLSSHFTSALPSDFGVREPLQRHSGELEQREGQLLRRDDNSTGYDDLGQQNMSTCGLTDEWLLPGAGRSKPCQTIIL